MANLITPTPTPRTTTRTTLVAIGDPFPGPKNCITYADRDGVTGAGWQDYIIATIEVEQWRMLIRTV